MSEWELPDAGVPLEDPPVALPDRATPGGGLPEPNDEWARMRDQRLVMRDHNPGPYRTVDFVVGGRRTAQAIPWASRASVAPWWERPDPFWETVLFDGARKWRRWASGTGEFTGEEVPFPVTDSGHAERDPTLPLSEVPIAEHAAFMGLLRLVGVASLDQITAMTGDPKARSKLRKLSQAGVTECAYFTGPGGGYPRVEMWRIRPGDRYGTYARQICAAAMQRSVFCGVSPFAALPGAYHTRHQSLAVEVMLRALETGGPWVGWLPEAVCSPDRFLPPGHPHLTAERAAVAAMLRNRKRAKPRVLSGFAAEEEIDHVSVRADGALIRMDGHKVFLEVQAGPSAESVVRKVANWGRLLASKPFGGLVLFVAAAKPTLIGNVVAEIKETIEREAPESARPSMLVASWQDWSPDQNELTEACRDLRSACLVDGEWQETTAAEAPVASPLPDWRLVSRLPDLAVTPPWLV